MVGFPPERPIGHSVCPKDATPQTNECGNEPGWLRNEPVGLPSQPMLPTLVLVHGSGHTSLIWAETVANLQGPAVAIDLPGRRHRPADLTTATIEASSAAAAADITAAGPDRVILVGHSSGGLILPSLAARLGARVCHLVFVAGLVAEDGHSVSEVISPGDPGSARSARDELRARYAGTTFGGLAKGEAPVGNRPAA